VSYFLTDQNLISGREIQITGNEAKHILLSRRFKKGERLALQGGDEKRFKVEIVNAGKKDLTVKVLDQIPAPPEPTINIALFQAVVNEKALDFILQKGTELGACKIVLFNSENVATKLSVDLFKKKFPRWQKICQEAAKQCDRVHPPKIEFVDDIKEALSNYQNIVLLDPAGGRFKDLIIEEDKDYAILVGPEGGFTQQEIDRFKSLPNCAPVCLGPLILRAETAALAGLAVMINF